MDVCLDLAISHKSLVLCLLASIIFKFINHKFKLMWLCQGSNMRHLDEHTLAYNASLCFSFTFH